MGLLSGDLQLASKFELLVHQLPFGTLFIGDDKTVNEGAYQLRTMFDDIIDCDIEVDEGTQKDKKEREHSYPSTNSNSCKSSPPSKASS